MIKNLVSIGCSWTLGDGLSDPIHLSYPNIIANHYGWSHESLSWKYASLQSILWTLNNWLDESSLAHITESLVLVGLTDESRFSWHNSFSVDNTENLFCTSKSDSQEWENINYKSVVRSIDGIAARHNLNLLQFNVLTKSHKLKVPTLIDSSSALEMLVIRNKPRKEPLFDSSQFPNERGHVVIADFLIEKINSIV